MEIQVVPVSPGEKEILRNLLEKYCYEFSQYDKTDINDLGLYGYEYLDHYWVEKNRYPFFIKVDGKLAGFAMINDYPEVDRKTDYTMSEFCVLYKYRGQGIGKFAAFFLFDRFKGRWQLRRHPHNVASVHFWNNIISQYTKGNYELLASCPDALYEDGTPGDVFLFET